ncbi:MULTISPECIES: hypothetical protein [unclassified Caballeronia]|uniref:hypothetical protein n=1 Tax=unclassified Caballeronia TaxID=2646786 RepID=UPI0032EC57F1
MPGQCSTGGRSNPLRVSEWGDTNIRHLLVQCTWAFMLRLEKIVGTHSKLAQYWRDAARVCWHARSAASLRESCGRW